MKISVQLYSLKEEIKNEGLEAVLEGIRTAGVDGVELVEDNYGLEVSALRTLLDNYGLKAYGSHVSMETLALRNIERVAVLDFKQLIVPYLPIEAFKDRSVFDTLSAVTDFYAAKGIEVGYHNHDHEFDGGADCVAELLNAVPLLKLEPDIYWLAYAGKHPVEYLEKWKNRLITIHLKELSKNGGNAPNPRFGQGLSEIKQCVGLAKKLKLPHVVVEFEGIDIPWREYLKSAVEYIRG